jgi:hypothetical protein
MGYCTDWCVVHRAYHCGCSGQELGSIRTGTFWRNDSTGDLQLASCFGHRLTRMDRMVVAIDEMFQGMMPL